MVVDDVQVQVGLTLNYFLVITGARGRLVRLPVNVNARLLAN